MELAKMGKIRQMERKIEKSSFSKLVKSMFLKMLLIGKEVCDKD